VVAKPEEDAQKQVTHRTFVLRAQSGSETELAIVPGVKIKSLLTMARDMDD
jgi:hypothetical protein